MIGRHEDIITVSGRAANVADGYGGVVEAWVSKWTGFAGVERRGGDRGIDAGAASLGSTYVFTVRTNPNVSFSKTDKIDWSGKVLSIVSIDESTLDRFTRITASCTT